MTATPPVTRDNPESLQRLFEPIDLAGLTISNRIVMTAHNGALSAPRYLAYLGARARGGVGLVIAAGGNLGLAEYSTISGPVSSDPTSFDSIPHNPATAKGIRHFDEMVVPVLRQRAEVAHAGERAASARCTTLVPTKKSTTCDPPSALPPSATKKASVSDTNSNNTRSKSSSSPTHNRYGACATREWTAPRSTRDTAFSSTRSCRRCPIDAKTSGAATSSTGRGFSCASSPRLGSSSVPTIRSGFGSVVSKRTTAVSRRTRYAPCAGCCSTT